MLLLLLFSQKFPEKIISISCYLYSTHSVVNSSTKLATSYSRKNLNIELERKTAVCQSSQRKNIPLLYTGMKQHSNNPFDQKIFLIFSKFACEALPVKHNIQCNIWQLQAIGGNILLDIPATASVTSLLRKEVSLRYRLLGTPQTPKKPLAQLFEHASSVAFTVTIFLFCAKLLSAYYFISQLKI